MIDVRRPAPRSLNDIRDPDGDPSYPVHLLEGCRDALILFAAAWHGRQDAVHIADAGLRGTCVDLDHRRLAEMEAVYPEGWEFVSADVFDFAESAYIEGYSWDVISLDPFTNLFFQTAALLETWTTMARRLVILGTGPDTVVEPPAGWLVTDVRKRSELNGGVFWTVLEPA